MSILILGGARSGKSRYAESLAKNYNNVTYIATATAVDEEIEKRIETHRRDRPSNWKTIEAAVKLSDALNQVDSESECVLIDCLTFWTNNCLFQSPETWHQEKNLFIESVDKLPQQLILVSNEVGMGITPMGAQTRAFIDELGWLHQELAQIMDSVILVVAGIPQIIKGEMPAKSA